LTTAKNHPDKYCEFCEEKIPRHLTMWYRRVACEKEECQEKKRLRILKRSRDHQKKIPFKNIFNKKPKEIIGKLNGRKCVVCNKQLRDPFKFRCPTCFKLVSNAYIDFESMNIYKHKSSHIHNY
jgi:hypothetical protein